MNGHDTLRFISEHEQFPVIIRLIHHSGDDENVFEGLLVDE